MENLNITQSLYTNSNCAVKVTDHRTAFFQQGCSLSPTLFNIYMNDLAPLSGKQKQFTYKDRSYSTALATVPVASTSVHRKASVWRQNTERKGSEGFYAIKSRCGQLKLPIKTWIQLYNSIIKPIIYMDVKFWGPVLNLKQWDETSIKNYN